ncbi:MAG: protease modulator HflC [Dokdonella sp.]|uniref:protease modulator HflC n=1 Tax=Dokdonella sp. TaxID=2291710 RepID=UPI002C7B6835|nr:protease modulator HflC [Dokdonella sp.]HOX71921.1 protease modulator HflC [Dokdonella sp.]HPN79988.1 protease modulator HflC [Dokdonella sp.]
MRSAISFVLAAVILLAFSCVYIVAEGQTAILLQFGRIVDSGLKPGLHFKLPLMQQAVRFDGRLQTLDAAAQRYLTSEKKDVNVDFVVKWKISDSSKFYTAVAGDQDQAQLRLAPIVKDGMRTAINSRTLQEVVSSARSDLTDSLVTTANNAATNLGIRIVDVRIKRVDLPEASSVLRSVYERMRSERKQVADALRAEGSEAAQRIRADADRQVQVIKANAYREAQTGRGEGDAEAAKVYAASYGKDAEFYAFYRSLEAYREAFKASGGVLVLDPKSEFLHYLQDSK